MNFLRKRIRNVIFCVLWMRAVVIEVIVCVSVFIVYICFDGAVVVHYNCNVQKVQSLNSTTTDVTGYCFLHRELDIWM